jgi:hypothetical protein
MTLRKIVNDIRTHAANHLKELGLSPVVRLADETAINDVIFFQTKGGREHIVAVMVPANAGEDAWDRAAIAPLNMRMEQLTGTSWILAHAEGVIPDSIEGFRDLDGVEQRVDMIVNHLASHGDQYVPRDDVTSQVCTDIRIRSVVRSLREIAECAGGDYVIRLIGEEYHHEDVVDTVELKMDDGREINVVLEEGLIRIAITGNDAWSSYDATVSDISAFERAVETLSEAFTEEKPGSAAAGY